MQLKPSPEYPESHARMYDPVCIEWQGLFEHSSISNMYKNETNKVFSYYEIRNI